MGRGVSVSTKMLHLKRPRLFPILDRLVVEVLGAALPEAQPAIRAQLAANIVVHVRTQGIRNIDTLRDIQRGLDRLGFTVCCPHSYVVLWLSHPAAEASGGCCRITCRIDIFSRATEASGIPIVDEHLMLKAHAQVVVRLSRTIDTRQPSATSRSTPKRRTVAFGAVLGQH